MNGPDEKWKKPSPFYQGVKRQGPEAYTKQPTGPYELFQMMDVWLQQQKREEEAKQLLENARAFPTAYPEISGAEINPAFREVLRWHQRIEPTEKFQKLSAKEKNRVRAGYFEQVVKPQLKPEEIEHYAGYFRPDFAESFMRGFVEPYTSMSSRFRLPPYLKPVVPEAQMAGSLVGALPKYYLAARAVGALGTVASKGLSVGRAAAYAEAAGGLPAEVALAKTAAASKYLETLRKVPYWLRSVGPGGHIARTTLQFEIADELPKVAMGKVDPEEILNTALIGSAFGFPKVSPLAVGGVATMMYGPEEGIKMTALTAAMHGIGAVPRVVSRARMKAANMLALKVELGRYQEAIGDMKLAGAVDLPDPLKLLDQIGEEKVRRASVTLDRVDRLTSEATVTAKRLGVASSGLRRLRGLQAELRALAERGPEVTFEEKIGEFFGELDALNEHLQMKYTRGLEDSEVRLTIQADQAMTQHPGTPSSKILQILKDRPIRVNSDVYRTADDRPAGPGMTSELDNYLASQVAGRGKPISLEQLQSLGVAPQDLASVVRVMRERNLLAVEPVQVTEPVRGEVAVESIYLERVSYLPRPLMSKFLTEAKDLAARGASLPLKTQRKLWLDFDSRLQKAIVEHWGQFVEEQKMELKEEIDKISTGEIEPEEAKAFGIPRTTYVKYQRLIQEWQRRIAEGEDVEVILTEVASEKIPQDMLPDELRIRPLTPEEHARAMNRARQEAETLYEEELEALAESKPLSPDEMAAAAEAGVLPREVRAQFSSSGEPPAGPDLLGIVDVLERKNVRAYYNSKTEKLYVDGKVTTIEELEKLPDAGDTTTKGEIVITVQGAEDLAILKRGDQWSVEEKPKLKTPREHRLRTYSEAEEVRYEKLLQGKKFWEIKFDQEGLIKLGELFENPGEIVRKFGNLPEGWTAANVAEFGLLSGEFQPISPKRGRLTDAELGRSLMQMHESWSTPEMYPSMKEYPQTLTEFTALAKWLREKGLITNQATTEFKEGLFMTAPAGALVEDFAKPVKTRRPPGPRSMDDLLDLMYAQGFIINSRTPTGGWKMYDLYTGQLREYALDEIETMLKEPRKIPDFTPGIETKVDPTSFHHPDPAPTDQPLRHGIKMGARYIMTRKPRFDMYERLYKVPTASIVYDSKIGTERAASRIRQWYRDVAIRAQNITKAVRADRQWRVMEYVFTPEEPLAKAQAASRLELNSLERQAAKEVENLSRECLGKGYRDLFDQAHDYLSVGERAPEIATWMKNYGWRPEYRYDMRAFLRNLLATRARKAWYPYQERLTQVLKDVEGRNDLSIPTKRKIQEDVRAYRDRAIAGLMGDQMVATDAIKAINKHLGLNLEGSILDKLVGEYLLLTYSSTMPFRLGLILRNLFQPALTTGLYVGPRYLAEGYRRALTREGWELYAEVNPRDQAPVAFTEYLAGTTPLEEVPSHLRPKTAPARLLRKAFLAGRAGEKAVREIYEKGMIPYFGADKLNIAVSANAGYAAVKDLAPRMLRGDISYREFKVKSGIIYLEEAAQNEIKAPLQEGNVDAAAKRAAFHMAEDTQWIYRAANAPWAFEKMGRWGRLAGQFGIWPASYIQFVKRGVMSGDSLASAKFLARWAALNFGMYYTGKEVFGVDLRTWIATGPLTYAGGPFVQMAQAATQMSEALFRARWEKDVAERELSEALLTTIPLRSMYRDWERAFSEEDATEAVKRLLGLRTLPSPRRRRR